MARFTAVFTRYNKNTARRQISDRVMLHGCVGTADRLNPSFDDAVNYANAILLGMQAADKDNEYAIVSITSGTIDMFGTGHFSGDRCNGPGMWERRDDMEFASAS